MTDTDFSLRTLFWEATLRCNAGCEFCGSRCSSGLTCDVDGDTVYHTFQRIADAYPAESIMVNVTGGEPLLRHDLFDVMKRVHRLGFPWGMVTNGSLINDSVIRKMMDSGMSTISVSIDGLFEAHERVRKLPDSFQRIINSIKKLAAADFLDEIQVTTVVTKESIGSLEEMYEYFAELPIDSWRIAPVDSIGRCEEHKQLLLEKEDYHKLAQFANAHIFDPRLTITASCSHYFGNADTLYREHAFHCDTGKHIASILADGSIYVCPNVPRVKELIQGNIKADDFVEIWKNGYQWFRNDDNRRCGKCVDCTEWNKCKGDSVHTWDFERAEPKFCWLDYSSVKQRSYDIPDRIMNILKPAVSSLSGYKITYGSSSVKTVFFLTDASDKVYRDFYWGREHPLNLFEQMVAMIGFIEGDKAFVVDIITVPLNDRSDNLASFTDDLHQYIIREVKIFNQNLSGCPGIVSDHNGQLVLLGYLHSHPGILTAHMSIPDIQLHNTMNQIYSEGFITGIVNPQSKDLCIYWDSVYSPVDVVMLENKIFKREW